MSVDNVLDDLFPTENGKKSKTISVSGSIFGGDTDDDEISSDESASSSDDFEELEVFDDKERARKIQTRGQHIVKINKQEKISKPKISKPEHVKLPSGPAYNDQRMFERELKTSETSKAMTVSLSNNNEEDDEFGFDMLDERKSDSIQSPAEFFSSEEKPPPIPAPKSGMTKATKQAMKQSLFSIQNQYRHKEEESSSNDDDEEEMNACGILLSNGGLDAIIEEEEEDDDGDEEEEEEDRIVEEEVEEEGTNSSFVPTNIQALTLRIEEEAVVKKTRNISSNDMKTENITYEDAMKYFLSESANLKHHDISPEDFSSYTAVERLTWKVKGPPSIRFEQGKRERDVLFQIAKVPLLLPPHSTLPLIHGRILKTVYRNISGSKHDVALSGKHWETIGFQSGDPGRDLRSSGMLSLIHMLRILEIDTDLVRSLWFMSQDSECEFPLMATSIHFTLRTLVALRTGRLYAVCNSRQSVTNVVQELYMSLMLAFYNDWKTNERKVSEFDTVSKLLESKISTSHGCSSMIAQWHKYKTNKQKQRKEEFQFSEIF